ncbi:MAG: ABC transporter permease [Actinomycetota bacterium]
MPNRTRWVLWLVALSFLAYLFVYPFVRILAESISGAGFASALSSGRLASAAWFTFWQAVVSTLLTLMMAWPLTWAVSRFRFRGKEVARALATVPFALPTVVVGAAFLGLTGRGIHSILAAHVFFNLAVVVRTVGGVWERVDPDLNEAAAVMGAGPWRRFLRVTLPILAPSIASACAIVFLFCFTSFGAGLILGGGSPSTIEVEIYRQAVNFLDLPVAAALAVIQLAVVVTALTISGRLQERAAQFLVNDDPLPQPGKHLPWVLLAVFGTFSLVAAPLIGLIARSLRGDGAGWRSLAGSGVSAIEPGPAIANSLAYALATMVLALLVGGSSAMLLTRNRARWFDTLLMLPLGTSAVTIGFGFLIALDRPVDLRGSWILVPLAHTLVAIPFVVRATLPVLRSIRTDLREAAAVLGASPARVWREVDLPIVARALAVGAGFAAVVSLGEFGATAFVARPASATVPTLIFRLLVRPGTASFATAMALSVVLMILTAGLILPIDRFRAGTF